MRILEGSDAVLGDPYQQTKHQKISKPCRVLNDQEKTSDLITLHNAPSNLSLGLEEAEKVFTFCLYGSDLSRYERTFLPALFKIKNIERFIERIHSRICQVSFLLNLWTMSLTLRYRQKASLRWPILPSLLSTRPAVALESMRYPFVHLKTSLNI